MRLKAFLSGDAMIAGKHFQSAWQEHLSQYGDTVTFDWESDWQKLQYRRLEVEKHGPEIENPTKEMIDYGREIDVLMGLFVPVSSKVMDAMPNLRIIGLSRAGLENVNLNEATKRGILVFNVQGRNAHAVSDYAVGMMLAECRNIARAHHAIKNGVWQKSFVNSESIPELTGRTVGLIGFGHIGRLVAKKLTGFCVRILVYDPYTDAAVIEQAGCIKAELDEVMRKSDFVSIHARLTEQNRNMIGKKEIGKMKPTAYLINTGRAGLVDQEALVEALQNKTIMGAALDVFTTEPIEKDSPFLHLDNVTLTTHIAGTTTDALMNSPGLLMEDVARFLSGKEAKFIVNPEVLQNKEFNDWLNRIR